MGELDLAGDCITFHRSRFVDGLELVAIWGGLAVAWYWSSGYTRIIVYVLAALIGIASVLRLVKMLPDGESLTLTPTGFVRRLYFHDLPERPWADFSEFAAVAPFRRGLLGLFPPNRWRKWVMWNYSDAYKAKMGERMAGSGRLETWEKRLAAAKKRDGYEALLLVNFGSRTNDVARLMEEFRRRAARESETVHS